ncbi:MAG: SsrA-binding protein SmpB [Candidatus Neomarinimicrobiota bacterium]
MRDTDTKNIATNRKAYHEFFIQEKFEAGIVLTGSEVKSLREGRANLKEGYVQVREREVWAVGLHISPYSHTGYLGHEPVHDRRLLLNRREIMRLQRAVDQKGMTIVPLRLYFKGGWAKLEIALARGKHSYDKKEAIKAKDLKRNTEREIGRY